MSLTPEQQQALAGWVTAGDNLSAIQKKLAEQFQVSMTYRDVRFLVDDLNLALKDPAPKVDTSDVSKTPAPALPPAPPAPGDRTAKKGLLDKAKEKLGLGKNEDASTTGADEPEILEDELEDELPPAGGNVSVAVDKVTLIPGAVASGTVTFSDGVTGNGSSTNTGAPVSPKSASLGTAPAHRTVRHLCRNLADRFSNAVID